MRKFSSSRFGVVQGSRVLFSDFADDGVMWAGQGPREVRTEVAFAPCFLSPPIVMVGVSMWDIDHKHNSRADISAANVTEQGFDLVFKTWGDTRVARIRADWTAFGEISDDEHWDV